MFPAFHTIFHGLFNNPLKETFFFLWILKPLLTMLFCFPLHLLYVFMMILQKKFATGNREKVRMSRHVSNPEEEAKDTYLGIDSSMFIASSALLILDGYLFTNFQGEKTKGLFGQKPSQRKLKYQLRVD